MTWSTIEFPPWSTRSRWTLKFPLNCSDLQDLLSQNEQKIVQIMNWKWLDPLYELYFLIKHCDPSDINCLHCFEDVKSWMAEKKKFKERWRNWGSQRHLGLYLNMWACSFTRYKYKRTVTLIQTTHCGLTLASFCNVVLWQLTKVPLILLVLLTLLSATVCSSHHRSVQLWHS